MVKWLKIDEFYLSVFLSQKATSASFAATRRALAGRSFQVQLRKALRGVVEQFPSLRRARLTVTR
jgi:hypothetical protein